MRKREILGLLLIALLIAGCEQVPAGIGDMLVWDSAGVRIVEVSFPDMAAIPQWERAQEPLVSVGEVEGEDPYLLERVFDARRTPVGGLLVLNYGESPGVRVFDPEGKFLKYMGRAGEGPGEFRGPESMHPYRGDSLAIWDHILRRFSVFSLDGELGRDIRPPPTWGGFVPSAHRALPDGGFLFIRQAWIPGYPMLVQNGWETTHAELLDHQGQFVDTIVDLPLIQLDLSPQGSSVRVEFGGLGFPVEDEPGFIWVRTDLGELRYIDLSGGVRQIVRLRAEPRPITKEIWDHHLQHQEAKWRETMGQENLTRVLGDLRTRPQAVSAPILSPRIHVSDGVLWLQRFSFDWEKAGPYLLLDPERGWLGTVAIPPGSQIHQVGEDYVVVVRKDDYDVEHVELYLVSEPAGGS